MIWQYTKQALMGVAAAAMVVLAGGLVYSRVEHMKFLSVQTGSMVPVLKKGDMVLVTRVPLGRLAVGDVITFANPAKPRQTITHRIAVLPSDATNGRIVTKGDANAAPDTPILPGMVVGKVRHHVPYAGYAVDSVRQPLGLALLIYVPALAIIIDEFRRLVAYYKKQVYRAPWRQHPAKSLPNGMVVGVFGIAVVVIAGGLLAAPSAGAALQTQATLGASSISTDSAPRATAATLQPE